MEIVYLGHACFRIKGKVATVVTDPYEKSVGFSMPKVSADIVTVSHNHPDHNAAGRVTGTSRRNEPYLISAPGEYEVSGVGVFGWGTYHDNDNGKERGKNTIYTIHMDGINVVHLGDLGHSLSDEIVENLGTVDILMTPVGGYYSLSAKEAKEVTMRLQPAIVIPMHYAVPAHNQEGYGRLAPVSDFLKEMDSDTLEPIRSLKINEQELPEETEVRVFTTE